MSINLKPFQESTVSELVRKISTLLTNGFSNSVCVFQSPTGSGKTLMTAYTILNLIQENQDLDLCFIWVSIGKGELHIQSKNKLKKYFNGFPRISLVEDEFNGKREVIDRNEVVVVNWEKLRSKEVETGEWKNVLMKDGEKTNFREVLRKTREKRKIILVIDESHIGATTERTIELKDEILADIILEMSATPKLTPSIIEINRGKAGFVYVEPSEVIAAGLIKKEIIINEDLEELSDDDKDSQELVLVTAYKKRLELKRNFEELGSDINPLVLIQIPSSEAGDLKLSAIREFFEKRNITETNGKLAIWLSEQKSETVEWISDSTNTIEFLIFKQAIDTGWDCPRAHILIRFREIHSVTFEIQTVGRILRMPEQKHYSIEALNKGYVFTNIQSIIVKKEEYNPNIIKHIRSKRVDFYENIRLESFYNSRTDYGDITYSFTKVFIDEACNYFNLKIDKISVKENIEKVLEKGIYLDTEKFKQEILTNATINTQEFDEIIGEIRSEEGIKIRLSPNDLQMFFEEVLINHLGSFRSVKRSIPDVKTAIYSWFRKYLGANKWDEGIILIQTIFLRNINISHFLLILDNAIRNYKSVRDQEIIEKSPQSEYFYVFEIPKEAYFNQYTDELLVSDKYAHTPCYLAVDRSKPERKFEKYLNDNSTAIKWWWKNGEMKIEYFGIKYEYPKGTVHTFYPDYLVKISNKTLIFEVKDENDRDGSSVTKNKAESLYEYIENHPELNISGGIVIERNNVFLINQKKIYDWEKCLHNNWEDWTILDLSE